MVFLKGDSNKNLTTTNNKIYKISQNICSVSTFI